MNILVDTSIWSLALRRTPIASKNDPIVTHLNQLIDQLQLVIIGPIRQELLSGIRNPDQFEQLRNQLRSFPDMPITTAVYELAAEFYNRCRQNGIQGSHIDFLICATAVHYSYPIFTTDQDFTQFQKQLPIQLYHPQQ